MNALVLNAPSADAPLPGVPDLEEQLRRLDQAMPDLDEYAEVWLAILDEMGLAPWLNWEDDDAEDEPGHILISFRCDQMERTRVARYDALKAAHPEGALEDIRTALRWLLLWERRYHDNRPVSAGEAEIAVREYVAMGGRIMLDPDGRLSSVYPLKDDHSIEVLEAKANTARAYTRIERRWRGREHVAAIVRAEGAPTDNGWLVLEARS